MNAIEAQKIEHEVADLGVKVFVERSATRVRVRRAKKSNRQYTERAFNVQLFNTGARRPFQAVLTKDVGREDPAPAQPQYTYVLDFPPIGENSMESASHVIHGAYPPFGCLRTEVKRRPSTPSSW